MNKTLAVSASALALMTFTATSSRAADLPTRMAPPAPIAAVPVFTWTGFYIGANLGAIRDASEMTLTANPETFNNGPVFPAGALSAADFAFMASRASEDETSFTGGGQIGYNYQVGGFVFGVEADINFSDVQNRRDRADPLPALFGGTPLPPLTYNARLHSDVDWFGTVRARAGAAVDRFLVYATGGLAYGHVKTNVAAFPTPAETVSFISNGLVDINQVRDSDTRFGWTIGGGVEYAFTNNLTLKGEYLYVDLGDKRHIAPAVEPALFRGSTMTASEETKFHVIRAGVNFKFNTW
ncbi:outer membrane protein [Microvirga massiliensis]|uniref:outer membrane protein n=1 Tax=Microvirga massiliensis TaxID=1033741 RepID=UPI0006609F7B|nr:outer membrane protein [Microvirga massiliensis]